MPEFIAGFGKAGRNIEQCPARIPANGKSLRGYFKPGAPAGWDRDRVPRSGRYTKKQICACPNIPCLNEKNLDSLLCADVRTLLESLDVRVELCHNAEAGFLHEKEQLFHATDPVRRSLAESQNILCVYHGTGIGLSGCMAGRLLRGNNGFLERSVISFPRTSRFSV